MRIPAVITLLVLAGVAALALPSLPRVPAGFDEGRKAFTEEVHEELIDPALLVERVFEYCDLHDMAAFICLHLLNEEIEALDAQLKLKGELARTRDPEVARATLAAATLKTQDVSKALATTLDARQMTLPAVADWLYARGFNFRFLQRALNGERLDAFNLRRRLRALEAPTARNALRPGLWEFNLLDAREEKGGHYKGLQLIEAMLALGFGPDDFDAVLKSDEPALTRKLTAHQRKLVQWGDPELIWPFMESGLPESTLMRRLEAFYAAKDDPRVLQVAMLRAETTIRWFRTGGPGVVAVYQGPWPANEGTPKPPSQELEALSDAEALRKFPSDEIAAHFVGHSESITLVLYTDGSARALLHRPGRQPVNYGAASPMGNRAVHVQMFEGRLSVAGRNGLLYSVYGAGLKVAPQEFELANVKQHADGALLAADLDDGINYTPILLRRVNRVIAVD